MSLDIVIDTSSPSCSNTYYKPDKYSVDPDYSTRTSYGSNSNQPPTTTRLQKFRQKFSRNTHLKSSNSSAHRSQRNNNTMPNFRNVHIPGPREMRDKFNPAQSTSGILLFSWALSSVLALIIPVCKWAAERNRYHNYYGQYNEYQQQQQQYEEQANGNGNYANYYNLCSWYDIKCKYRMRQYTQMYGNNNGDGGGSNDQAQMRAMMPAWYFFFGGSLEEDERQREEMGMGQNDGSMKFVYASTIIMFIGLSIFGFRSMYDGKDRLGVIVALLIFGWFSLMNLLTTVQGTIETDNQYFEESIYGWFGQWSVLVAYTDFWLMLHCFGFAAVLSLFRCLDKRAQKDVAHDEQAEANTMEMGYSYRQEEDSVMTERQRHPVAY